MRVIETSEVIDLFRLRLSSGTGRDSENEGAFLKQNSLVFPQFQWSVMDYFGCQGTSRLSRLIAATKGCLCGSDSDLFNRRVSYSHPMLILLV